MKLTPFHLLSCAVLGSAVGFGLAETTRSDRVVASPELDRVVPEREDPGREAVATPLEAPPRATGRARRALVRRPAEESLPVRDRESGAAFLDVAVDGLAGSRCADRIRLALRSAHDPDAEPSAASQPAGGAESVDGAGPRRFGPLRPGACELVLSVRTDGDRYLPVARVPVDLAPGENRASISLPPLHALTVLVGAEDQGAELRLATTDGRPAAILPADSRTIVLDGLPAGRYELSLTRGREPMRRLAVSIPTQSMVELAQGRENGLVVAVQDPEGYLARNGFRDGDVVVGADGIPFVDSTQMHTALLHALQREEMSVSVLRDGSPVDLTVQPRAMLDHVALGGRIDPTNL